MTEFQDPSASRRPRASTRTPAHAAEPASRTRQDSQAGHDSQAAQAKDAAADVASSGKQAATDVATTGAQAAAETIEQTKQQAGDLLGQTRDQLTEQIDSQKSSTVQTLRSLGDQLASMTETDEDGTAVDVAARLRDRARETADWLDARNPDQVLDEVRRYGSDKPGAFLLGAAVAGIVAGRLTRGVVDVHRDGSGSTEDRR